MQSKVASLCPRKGLVHLVPNREGTYELAPNVVLLASRGGGCGKRRAVVKLKPSLVPLSASGPNVLADDAWQRNCLEARLACH